MDRWIDSASGQYLELVRTTSALAQLAAKSWSTSLVGLPWAASACLRPKSDQPLILAIDPFGVLGTLEVEERGAEPVARREGEWLGFVVVDLVFGLDRLFEGLQCVLQFVVAPKNLAFEDSANNAQEDLRGMAPENGLR